MFFQFKEGISLSILNLEKIYIRIYLYFTPVIFKYCMFY